MEPPTKRPKRGAAAYSTERILNANSPITSEKADIQTFLSLCMHNWTNYTEEEKSTIISKLPQTYRILDYDEQGLLKCPIDPQFLLDDSVIKDQIARFKRDVKDGFHTKTWQEKAAKAMEDRAGGKFDQYLAEHMEEMFPIEDVEEEKMVVELSSDGEYHPKQQKMKGNVQTGADSDVPHQQQAQEGASDVESAPHSERTKDISIQDEEELAQ